jgi:phospholipase C
MDRYVADGGAGGLPMGSYDATTLPLGQLARHYTLADNFFHAAFGGSLLNHLWLVSWSTPRWDSAPASMRAVVGADSQPVKDGAVTPDGYLVNTAYPQAGPHPLTTPANQLVPPLTGPTIGDRLNAKGISWAWYANGWADAVGGHPAPLFQFNHQPFAYFANYANGTAGAAAHLKDETDLVKAVRTNTLPAVSFYQPIGSQNEHPGYANLVDGERNTADLIRSIMASKDWNNTAVIVTYDENGGFWDHVAPPSGPGWGDRFGPATRIPTLIVSPFAKRGFVDKTAYDTTSIIKFLTTRFDLEPLPGVRKNMGDLTAATIR